MYLILLVAMFTALCLFYWQYRQCIQSQRSEENLKQKNENLGCFAYAAAHDLKAPLRAIMQISERLDGALHERMDAAQREDMNLLRQRALRLHRLIDDLLEYWQAGQPEHHYPEDKTDVHALVHEVVNLLSPPDSFTFEIPDTLKSVPVYQSPLEQVLLNVIGNALKHHDRPGGRVRFEWHDLGNLYRFCVSDDGPGIPDLYKEKVFEVFETLKSRDEVEGSGLGLSLVRRIVRRQGGTVHIDAAPGRGTAVIFTWPKINT